MYNHCREAIHFDGHKARVIRPVPRNHATRT